MLFRTRVPTHSVSGYPGGYHTLGAGSIDGIPDRIIGHPLGEMGRMRCRVRGSASKIRDGALSVTCTPGDSRDVVVMIDDGETYEGYRSTRGLTILIANG